MIASHPVHYEIAAIAWRDATDYLTENVVTGFDASHQEIAFYPEEHVIWAWKLR